MFFIPHIDLDDLPTDPCWPVPPDLELCEEMLKKIPKPRKIGPGLQKALDAGFKLVD